jgi:hypothetical protein
MYKLRNPTLWCGGPVPGGLPCVVCPDEMPPAFLIGGGIADNVCNTCSHFDGLRLEQFPEPDSCDYVNNTVVPDCASVDVNLSIAEFIFLIFVNQSAPNDPETVVYRKVRNLEDSCNVAHTLQLFSNGDDENICNWPDELTVNPSD